MQVPARLAGPRVALLRGEGAGPSGGTWQVVLGDEVVGTCAWQAAADATVVVSGEIVPHRRGTGLGTEAAAVLTAWAERQPGVRLLAADVRVDAGPRAAAAGAAAGTAGAQAALRLLGRLGFVEHGSHPPVVRLVRPAPGLPRPRGRHVC